MKLLHRIYTFITQYIARRNNISLLEYFLIRYRQASWGQNTVKLKLKHANYITIRPRTSDLTVVDNFLLKQDYATTIPNALNIIDAGANIGCSTILFKKRYPKSTVVSIEPSKNNCEIFLQNTSGLEGVFLIHGALASKHNQYMEIIDKSVSPYSYQMKYSDKGIKTISINKIMEKYHWRHIDVLKLDIEGGEKDIFSCELDWLKATRQIIIELHDYKTSGCSQTLINSLCNRNFNISFQGENLILINNDVVGNK